MVLAIAGVLRAEESPERIVETLLGPFLAQEILDDVDVERSVLLILRLDPRIVSKTILTAELGGEHPTVLDDPEHSSRVQTRPNDFTAGELGVHHGGKNNPTNLIVSRGVRRGLALHDVPVDEKLKQPPQLVGDVLFDGRNPPLPGLGPLGGDQSRHRA